MDATPAAATAIVTAAAITSTVTTTAGTVVIYDTVRYACTVAAAGDTPSPTTMSGMVAVRLQPAPPTQTRRRQ